MWRPLTFTASHNHAAATLKINGKNQKK
jgi:hypothetical protein